MHSLLLDQLLYTSFPGIGFKLIDSHLPQQLQQAFLEKIVYQHWDAYNPPSLDYKGAYIYQLSLEETFFGWLYNDGQDELGREHIPYFICYFLNKNLHPVELDCIFNCLHTGPLKTLTKHTLPSNLEKVPLPDFPNYQPSRRGIEIPVQVREDGQIALRQKKTLDFFVPATESHSSVISKVDRQQESSSLSSAIQIHSVTQEPIDKSQEIREVLIRLLAKPISIQDAILVSAEGKPLTPPFSLDENNILIIAGTMLYLSKTTGEEFGWQQIQQIRVQAQEGYLILSKIGSDIFLLVQAAQVLSGLLEGEINRTVRQIKLVLSSSVPVSQSSQFNQNLFTELDAEIVSHSD